MNKGPVSHSHAAAFEKSLLPYTVDIVDLNAVSREFRASIEKDFVKIV